MDELLNQQKTSYCFPLEGDGFLCISAWELTDGPIETPSLPHDTDFVSLAVPVRNSGKPVPTPPLIRCVALPKECFQFVGQLR